eukprot:TRINITY_DN1369_c0_g1_i4.p1 TRINITY_DN1369_c0_g1~~TRINITY_DN1369_c0_g1_i4.p1  ORF type:complete len:171 (-),score=82.40 TRINITY_DN1369_c0_g1_i4:435-947(-)
MKPAWDKLMKEYADSKTALVGDVDCTAEGKDLCETVGVQGFPTIKYGDPADMQDYEGGRDFKALQKFAKENLKPLCSPTNLDLCDAEKKAEIEKFMKMSDADLEKQIEEKEGEIKAADEHFEAEVKKLQETYEKLQEDKTNKVKEVKDSGLGLMKSVKVAKAKGGSKSEL